METAVRETVEAETAVKVVAEVGIVAKAAGAVKAAAAGERAAAVPAVADGSDFFIQNKKSKKGGHDRQDQVCKGAGVHANIVDHINIGDPVGDQQKSSYGIESHHGRKIFF